MYEKAKVTLKKLHKEIKKYVDKNKKKAVKYKIENRMLLSTTNLVQQIRNKEAKKLTKKFMKPYKIKKIILENVVELEIVNVSRIILYQEQIKKQKKILPSPIEIDK